MKEIVPLSDAEYFVSVGTLLQRVKSEMAVFRYCDLPAEVQGMILEAMPASTLSRMCRVNKSVSAETTPMFWRAIDFPAMKPEIIGDDLEHAMRRFFQICYALKQGRPLRWKVLSAYVRTLRLARVAGIWIPNVAHHRGEVDWILAISSSPGGATVYDVISSFRNIEELHFYLKGTLDYDERVDELAKQMSGALPRLCKLHIGGDLNKEVVLALLSSPESVEEFSCTALSDGTVGQDANSGGLLFLSSIQHRFSKLKKLHLCKLAELVEVHEEDSDNEEPLPANLDPGFPWPWDRANDREVLSEWASFIKHVSDSLESLTIEDRYPVAEHLLEHKGGERWRFINPAGRWHSEVDGHIESTANKEEEGEEVSDEEETDRVQRVEHPEEWGAASRTRFREILLPVLADLAWPNLKTLTLIGMSLPGEGLSGTEDVVLSSLEHLRPRVTIETRPGGVIKFEYDVTPLTFSPPAGQFSLD